MNNPLQLDSIGLIGCGNMGSALAKGIRVKMPKVNLTIFDNGSGKKQAITDLGASAAESATEVATKSSVIILAVKPEHVAHVLEEITPALSAQKTIVSIAAGITIGQMQENCSGKAPVVRIMPNTLAKAGHGHFGLCLEDPKLSETQKDNIRQVFSLLGATMELPEAKMNAYSALAGCGPAYVFYFMEALAEAGVSIGLGRNDATDIAMSLLEGAVALAKQEEVHLAILREEVCSPGGMTIAGINVLDQFSARSTIVEAVKAAKQRGDELGS